MKTSNMIKIAAVLLFVLGGVQVAFAEASPIEHEMTHTGRAVDVFYRSEIVPIKAETVRSDTTANAATVKVRADGALSH